MKKIETQSGAEQPMRVEGGANTPVVSPPSFNLTSDAPLQGFGMEEGSGGATQLAAAPIQREPDPASPPEESTHVVQRGETPRALAQRFGVTVEALKAANQVHTWNINGRTVEGFEAGQTITIPAAPSTETTTEQPVTETVTETTTTVTADTEPTVDEPATADEAAELEREEDGLDRVHMFSRRDNSFVASRWENSDDSSTGYADTFDDQVADELETEFGRPITHAEVLELIRTETEAGNTEQAEEYRRQLFRANQYAVVEALNVDQTNSGRTENVLGRDYRGSQNHELYGPTTSDTYCNIYAYDAVTALGGYIPRVWWTTAVEAQAIAAMEAGTEFNTDIEYGVSVREMNANSINAWFDRVGEHFGWRQATDMEEAQNAANNGNIVVLSAANVNARRSGHISMIMSERTQHQADRGTDGDVTIPLTSQAGSSNHKHETGSSWWNNASHTNGNAWIHEGAASSPILTPEQLGLAGTETTEQEETVNENATANVDVAGPTVDDNVTEGAVTEGGELEGGETTNANETEGGETDDSITISSGIMQMISEGSFDGTSDDVRKPHFPENLFLFEPIPAGVQVPAENRYNVSDNNRYAQNDSGTFKIKRRLNRHRASDYDTPLANGERVATGRHNSGVTIGFGYDIGAAWNVGDKASCKAEFIAAGISESDADALADCVGLRTTEAGKKAATLRETLQLTADQAVNLLSVAMERYDGNFTEGSVHPALEEVFLYINYWQGVGGGRAEVTELSDAAQGHTGAAQFQAVLDEMDTQGWNTGAYIKIQRYIRTIKGYLESGQEVNVVDSTNLQDLLGGDNDTFRVVRDATNGNKDYQEQLTGEAITETETTTTTGGSGTTTDSPAVTPGDAGVRSHTVRSGETPAQIATQYGVTVEALLAGNRVHTWNINGRQVRGFQSGQVITIPAGGTRESTTTTPATPANDSNVPVAPATEPGGGSPSEQVNAQYQLYSEGELTMPALARALKPYAASNGSLVIGVIDKLGWSERDNFSYALSSNSSDAELGGYDRTLLTRMSSELDAYLSLSWSANSAQKERVDAAMGTGLSAVAKAGASVAARAAGASGGGGNEPVISADEFAAGETMTTEDQYQKGNAYIPFTGASGTSYQPGDSLSNGDANSMYGHQPTWCNQFAFDFIRASTDSDPFGGINQLNYTASAMLTYMEDHPDVFASAEIDGAWDNINSGDLMIFATPGHISIGYPTDEADMQTRNASGTDYEFGKVIQAGSSTGIMGLNYAWSSKSFPSIKVFRYTGR